MRWKIELFFKILKSGFHAEKLKLRAAERLVNLIAIFCILGWWIFWLTMLNRARPNEGPGCALTASEIAMIDRIAAHAGRVPAMPQSLSTYLVEMARLGGYLARRHDPPPGNMIMWRAGPDSWTSNSAQRSRPSHLWVIESFAERIQLNNASCFLYAQ
jgi:hypothetical protein